MPNVELLHVYVIEDEHNTVKIGVAGNVAKRINAIDQATAYQIINRYESPSCINAREIEKAAHKHFAKQRKKGEWFTIVFDDAVDYVKGHFVTQQLVPPVEQSQVVINNHQMPVLVYNNQRVVTFAMIDQVHQRPTGTAGRNFRENRKHFIEGDDFYTLDSNSLDVFRRDYLGVFGDSAQHSIVLTQMGYLMVVKSLKDDLAWQVQRQLVTGYFAQSTQPALTPEIETFITARVHDEVANVLTKPATSKMDCVQDAQDDAWEEAISLFLDTLDKVHTYQLQNVVGLNPAKISRLDTVRIKSIMERLGWQKCVPTIEGKRLRGYLRPR